MLIKYNTKIQIFAHVAQSVAQSKPLSILASGNKFFLKRFTKFIKILEDGCDNTGFNLTQCIYQRVLQNIDIVDGLELEVNSYIYKLY